MKPRKIVDDVYWMGFIDWSNRLFDSLIPLPDGTSYNSYFIRGSEKNVLIDTVEPAEIDELMEQLKDVHTLDYIISLHSEQDHSGAIPLVLKKYPKAKVICSEKAVDILLKIVDVPKESIITVKDGEKLSLGNRTLQFIYTPWVHWPETMVAYLEEDKILFSCDFFGAHIATTDLFVTDKERVYEAAKRYYAEIMMPFRKIITKNLKKIEKYDIQIIAPSHGQIYQDPSFIIDAHKDWTTEKPKNLVVLPYVSMHGSTKKMVDYLTEVLTEKGVPVQQYDMAVTDIGKLAISIVDAATIIIGSPTVLSGPHPASASAAFLANALRPKAKFVSIIASYGWGCRTLEILSDMISNIKAEVIPPLLIKGYPKEEDFKMIENMAETIVQKHKEAGLL